MLLTASIEVTAAAPLCFNYRNTITRYIMQYYTVRYLSDSVHSQVNALQVFVGLKSLAYGSSAWHINILIGERERERERERSGGFFI